MQRYISPLLPSRNAMVYFSCYPLEIQVTIYNVEMKWYAFNILLSRCKDGCLENRISSGDKICCAAT